jgi:hypothetical protein
MPEGEVSDSMKVRSECSTGIRDNTRLTFKLFQNIWDNHSILVGSGGGCHYSLLL